MFIIVAFLILMRTVRGLSLSRGFVALFIAFGGAAVVVFKEF